MRGVMKAIFFVLPSLLLVSPLSAAMPSQHVGNIQHPGLPSVYENAGYGSVMASNGYYLLSGHGSPTSQADLSGVRQCEREAKQRLLSHPAVVSRRSSGSEFWRQSGLGGKLPGGGSSTRSGWRRRSAGARVCLSAVSCAVEYTAPHPAQSDIGGWI